MKLENQVCTLEQAKRLKELGVSRINKDDGESGFYWVSDNEVLMFHKDDGFPSSKYIRAFSVAELGVALIIDDDIHFTDGRYNEHLGCWESHLEKRNPDTEELETPFLLIHEARQEAETEAEARADLLIYLIENGITTSEEVNKRLKAA